MPLLYTSHPPLLITREKTIMDKLKVRNPDMNGNEIQIRKESSRLFDCVKSAEGHQDPTIRRRSGIKFVTESGH